MTYDDPERKVSTATRRANVFGLLNRHPGVWISGADLCRPDVGGSEGLRRVRELRAQGWKIEHRKRQDGDGHEYRLIL